MMQTAFNAFVVSLLFVPAVTLICRRTKKSSLLSPALLVVSLMAGLAVAVFSFWTGNRVVLDLSSLTPFPFALTVDRLSGFFLLLICFVGVPITVFSAPYVERHYHGGVRDWFWVLLPLFFASMILVVTASTAFAFLFGWELMTLFSAALVLIEGDSGPRRRNLCIYLLMMHAGAAAVVGAFLLFMPHSAGLDFASMRSAAAQMPRGVRTAIFLLAFVGFGTKAGIMPLHMWLPKAHPIAPSPVSALMSGVMLKTAIYGMVRFTFDFLGGGPSWWGYAMLAAGAISGVLGVLHAIGDHDLKRLLAYSSVENIGIIYLGLGTALVLMSHNERGWAAVALTAALLHAFNHALFKGLLFLGAGAISDATHTLNLEEMGGLLRRMPVTGCALLVGCCSIAGLPLLNGFVSEWLTFRSFLAGSTIMALAPSLVLPLMAGVLALIGGLAAVCFAKVYGIAFLGRPRNPEVEHAHEVPAAMQIGMGILAATCAVIGIAPGIFLQSIGRTVGEVIAGSVIPNEAFSIARVSPWIALFISVVIAAIFGVGRLRSTLRITPTWACGLPGLDERMQYTATAYSKPVRQVFSQVYKPDRSVEVLPADEGYFPSSISYRSVRTTSIERSLYRPVLDAIVAAAYRLRRLQTGNIQIYLLYIFVALIALLVFMRFA